MKRKKTYYDFSDDTWLAEWAEKISKGSGEEQDEAYLYDEQGKRVVKRIVALEYAVGCRFHRRYTFGGVRSHSIHLLAPTPSHHQHIISKSVIYNA